MPKQTRSNCFLFLLFFALILAAYANSFTASWQLDDKPNILKNHRIQLSELSFHGLMQAAFAMPGSGTLYRPVACISLALNWFIGQDNVLGYHIVNFLIHIGCSWLLFLTIKFLFETPRLKGRYTGFQIELMAAIAVLFWALNPMQVQAITYIVQRMTALAALFSILALLCYFKARMGFTSLQRMGFLFCSIIAYLIAVLSKENAAAIVLMIPVVELLFFHQSISSAQFRQGALLLVIGAGIAVLAGVLLRPELFDFIVHYYDNRPFTLVERVLTEQRILLFYLSQLFWPAPGRLSIEHDIALSTSFFQPWTTGAAITVHFLLILLAVRMGRKQPLFSFAVLFFYFNHLVESTIIPLELVFEHRNYLPSVFLFLPLAQLIVWAMQKVDRSKVMLIMLTFCLAFVFAAEGYATYTRNKAWQTEESLWLDALKKAPNSSRPLANLAIKLAWGPNPDEVTLRRALKLTEKTLSLRMARVRFDAAQLDNMASIYNKLGEYAEADNYYQQALILAPDDAGIRYKYCKNLIMAGRFPQAKQELLKILEKGFVHADYFHMLGFIELWEDRPQTALPAVQQAMKSAPGRPDILMLLGKTLSALGHHGRAAWYYSLARKNGRNDGIMALCRIENMLRAGRPDQAKKILTQALTIYPVSSLINPLTAKPGIRHRNVPFDEKRLIDYIQSALPDITSAMLFSGQ